MPNKYENDNLGPDYDNIENEEEFDNDTLTEGEMLDEDDEEDNNN